MTSTMKKAPKKKAAPKVEPTAEAIEATSPSPSPTPVFVPPDRLLPPPRSADANAQLSSCLRSIVAFADLTQIEGVIAALTDEEFFSVWAWMRQVDWLVDGHANSETSMVAARRADLTVPACIAAFVDKEVDGADAIQATFLESALIIDENAAPVEPSADAPSSTHQVAEVAAPEAVTEAISGNDQATVKEPDATGQLPLVDEVKQPPKKITALSLESSDDVADVRTAMQIYADDLESQAKNCGKLNKHAEAASLRKTVARLKHKIDKQLSVQTAIAFNVNESIPKMVSRYVSGEIRSRAFAALMKSKVIKKGESAKDAEDRQRAKLDDLEALIGNIGDQAGAHVATLVVEAYERGKDQGFRERSATASQVIREAIEAAESQRSA